MQFLDIKCKDSKNVQNFLEKLVIKQEELSTVGVVISKEDYRPTIISCLPRNFASFASSQLAVAQLINSMKKVDPDVLILLISEEYDC